MKLQIHGASLVTGKIIPLFLTFCAEFSVFILPVAMTFTGLYQQLLKEFYASIWID